MAGFFRNTKSTIVNIAQILLVAFALPFCFLICYIVNPDPNSSIFNFVMDMLSQISLFDVAASVIKDYLSYNSQNIGEISLLVILKAFPDTVFVSVVVHALNTIFVHMWRVANLAQGDASLFVKPMTVFPTFVGLCLSTAILKLLNSWGNMVALISELAVIVIMVFGFKLMFKSMFGGRRLFSIHKILVLIIDGIYAVILVCFVAILAVVAFSNPRMQTVDALRYISESLVATTLASVIVWVVRNAVDKSKSII